MGLAECVDQDLRRDDSYIRRAKGLPGVFAPGFVAFDAPPGKPTGLVAVDHMVGNVELGR